MLENVSLEFECEDYFCNKKKNTNIISTNETHFSSSHTYTHNNCSWIRTEYFGSNPKFVKFQIVFKNKTISCKFKIFIEFEFDHFEQK